jgi:hypothetical protein
MEGNVTKHRYYNNAMDRSITVATTIRLSELPIAVIPLLEMCVVKTICEYLAVSNPNQLVVVGDKSCGQTVFVAVWLSLWGFRVNREPGENLPPPWLLANPSHTR